MTLDPLEIESRLERLDSEFGTHPSHDPVGGSGGGGVFEVIIRDVRPEGGFPEMHGHRLYQDRSFVPGVFPVMCKAKGELLRLHPMCGLRYENFTWPGIVFPLLGPLDDEILVPGSFLPFLAFKAEGEIRVAHCLVLPPASVEFSINALRSAGSGA